MEALLENRGHSTIRSARVPNSPQAIPAKSRFSGTPRWTKSDPERVWYSFLRISSIDLHNNCCYEIIDLAGENCDSFFKLSPFAPREYIFYFKLGVPIHLNSLDRSIIYPLQKHILYWIFTFDNEESVLDKSRKYYR